MKPSEILATRREDILAIAAKYPVANVRVFGSVLRGEDKEGSDLDILVEALPGLTYFDLGGLQHELEADLGLRVDVVTERALSSFMKERVLREARPV